MTFITVEIPYRNEYVSIGKLETTLTPEEVIHHFHREGFAADLAESKDLIRIYPSPLWRKV